jgi:hypothetical protein
MKVLLVGAGMTTFQIRVLNLSAQIAVNDNVGTEEYLHHLKQSIKQPTLEDLQKHRPIRLPSAPSPTYNKVYNDTLDHLSKSFTKQQLLAFEQIFGRGHAKSKNKRIVLESVMEHGLNIPSPSSIEKGQRERTEIHSEREQPLLGVSIGVSDYFKQSHYLRVPCSSSWVKVQADLWEAKYLPLIIFFDFLSYRWRRVIATF